MDNETYNDTDEENIKYILKDYFILFSPCIFLLLFLLCLFFMREIDNRFILHRGENVLDNLDDLEYEEYMILNDDCSICLDNLNTIDIEKNDSVILKTECNHIFHRYCIINDTINKCPICREPIKFKSYCIIKNLSEFIIESSGESIV